MVKEGPPPNGVELKPFPESLVTSEVRFNPCLYSYCRTTMNFFSQGTFEYVFVDLERKRIPQQSPRESLHLQKIFDFVLTPFHGRRFHCEFSLHNSQELIIPAVCITAHRRWHGHNRITIMSQTQVRGNIACGNLHGISCRVHAFSLLEIHLMS